MTNLSSVVPALRAVLKICRRHLRVIALQSAIINLLYLTPTLFMLQVYDRVVPTGGLATLFLLGCVTILSFAMLAALDLLRGRLLVKASMRIDQALVARILSTIIQDPRLSRIERSEALRNLDRLRSMLSGPALIAALDAPWVPIYLLAISLLHPALGLFTLCSGALLVTIAWCAERAVEQQIDHGRGVTAISQARLGQMTAYAADIRALGMAEGLCRAAIDERTQATRSHAQTSLVSGRYASLGKFVRMTSQSGALALAAWLTVESSLSAGAIFAASLLLGRALAPIEMLVGSWKTVVQGLNACRAIASLGVDLPARQHIVLPRPMGALSIENLSLQTSDGRWALASLSFGIDAGELLGIAGASGAGKSSLLKCLSSAQRPTQGCVRLDGAALENWNDEQLAHSIGYASQETILFSGSIRDNIARFALAYDRETAEEIDQKVVAAARAIGAHDLILRLTKGYETSRRARAAGSLGRSDAENSAGTRPLRRSVARHPRRAERPSGCGSQRRARPYAQVAPANWSYDDCGLARSGSPDRSRQDRCPTGRKTDPARPSANYNFT